MKREMNIHDYFHEPTKIGIEIFCDNKKNKPTVCLVYNGYIYRVFQKNNLQLINLGNGKFCLHKYLKTKNRGEKNFEKVVDKEKDGHLVYLCYPHKGGCQAKIHLTIVNGIFLVRVRNNQASKIHQHSCNNCNGPDLRNLFSDRNYSKIICLTKSKKRNREIYYQPTKYGPVENFMDEHQSKKRKSTMEIVRPTKILKPVELQRVDYHLLEQGFGFGVNGINPLFVETVQNTYQPETSLGVNYIRSDTSKNVFQPFYVDELLNFSEEKMCEDNSIGDIDCQLNQPQIEVDGNRMV